jgi:hypothetical protein
MTFVLEILFGFLPFKVQMTCLGLAILVLGLVAGLVWLSS